jgi:lipoyl(octanoyl) transferase
VYPILDLNRLNLGLHEYMRLLESAIIQVCRTLGLSAAHDASATGVWIDRGDHGPSAKVCAMGVRVRKWISMHGLALNVDPNMSHFDLIVPCGLAGRGVTSLRRELGERTPSMSESKRLVSSELSLAIAKAATQADQGRIAASPTGTAGELGT